jgi:Tol biopolymer transport system component
MDDVRVALQEIKEESESDPAAVAVVRRAKPSLRLAAIAGSVILASGIGTWLLRSRHDPESGVLRVVPLTNFKGVEDHPTFSPDGQQVAFAWDGEREDNYDIYVKLVGSPEVRRLTSDPAADISPRWSPDGQKIAFVRNGLAPPATVHVVSPLGGADREVSDFSVAMGLDWSPDSHWIAVGHLPMSLSNRADVPGIYLIPVDGGDPRLLVPAEPTGQHILPTFAPDGRRVAYISCSPQHPQCTVNVVELDAAAFKPVTAPRQLMMRPELAVDALAWSRDGRSVIVSAWDNVWLHYLWRVPADGSQAPERIEVAGLGAGWPATVFSRDRLAFVRNTVDVDLYRFVSGRPPEVVAASSFPEMYAGLSADGRVAFTSTRSTDAMQIWVSGADGSEPQQLTRGKQTRQSPSWSPDARHIAFDSTDDSGHGHIWVMDADGTHSRQITADPGDQNMPAWSGDGRWIYFSWSQDSGRDIWRIPSGGGPKQRVTREGAGWKGRESADGQSLVYQRADTGALVAVSLSGGSPRQLIPCVTDNAFDVAVTGIFYVPCVLYGATAQLHVIEPNTGADRLLGPLENLFRDNPVLAVSRDGRIVLYNRDSHASDLMMIENFR